VVVFVGQLTALNARQRRQGVADELAGKKDAPTDDGAVLGKYKIYKTFTDAADTTKAKENAVQALTELSKEPNVCMVGLWAYNPPAILSAVKATPGALGRVKIVGFDEEVQTLNGIKEGHVYGTIVQQPYQFGYKSVKLMSQIVRGDRSGIPKDGMMPVPHVAVTKDGKEVTTFDGKKTEGKTAEVFHKELNKLLGR
jgi:ribose transport system substrate-binding protein